jgi:hypothetical protein
MSGDEFGVFTALLVLADYRTGIWIGSGVALASYLKRWSPRKCQRILASLNIKHYIALRHSRGKKGSFPVIIHNYNKSVEKVTTLMTPLSKSDDTNDATFPKVTTPATTLKEVKQELKTKKKSAQPRRVSSLVDEQEQRRRIEGRDRRLEKEADSRKEINVGYNWISEEIERLARQKVMVR